MEIRALRYFLETAREENMSQAAKRLYVSQSALSRQIKSLEEELGQKLFIRHSFHIELTEAGILLRKRAEDILKMVDKTCEEFQSLDDTISGEIQIGCSESQATHLVARVLVRLHQLYPGIRYHLKSGNTEDITGDLDKGLLDFAIIAQPVNLTKYQFLALPSHDTWGVILPKTHPLAQKETLNVNDIQEVPLIVSRQGLTQDYPKLFGQAQDALNIVATFNLPYNGSLLVKEGLGFMLCFDGLIDTSEQSELCFRPLSPKLESEGNLIWKKYQAFSPASQALLDLLRTTYGTQPEKTDTHIHD